MDPSKPILFYDIASGPPRRTYAPNPWKTRLALNIKNLHYRTEWTELPAVTATRKRLGAPPNRLLPDGSDFYTLPIIKDTSHDDAIVGDTFDIAVYLDKTYPDAPRLLTSPSQGLYQAFNVQVDAIFTGNVQLCTAGMPLNPANAHEYHAICEERFPGLKWEDMGVSGEARERMWEKLKGELGVLVKVYGRGAGGPFLDGEVLSYADVIVGAWLLMFRACVPEEEWRGMCAWHDGLWGRLVEGLEPYTEIK